MSHLTNQRDALLNILEQPLKELNRMRSELEKEQCDIDIWTYIDDLELWSTRIIETVCEFSYQDYRMTDQLQEIVDSWKK